MSFEEHKTILLLRTDSLMINRRVIKREELEGERNRKKGENTTLAHQRALTIDI